MDSKNIQTCRQSTQGSSSALCTCMYLYVFDIWHNDIHLNPVFLHHHPDWYVELMMFWYFIQLGKRVSRRPENGKEINLERNDDSETHFCVDYSDMTTSHLPAILKPVGISDGQMTFTIKVNLPLLFIIHVPIEFFYEFWNVMTICNEAKRIGCAFIPAWPLNDYHEAKTSPFSLISNGKTLKNIIEEEQKLQ